MKTIYSFNEFFHSKLGLKFYFVFHLKEVFAKDDTFSAFRTTNVQLKTIDKCAVYGRPRSREETKGIETSSFFMLNNDKKEKLRAENPS